MCQIVIYLTRYKYIKFDKYTNFEDITIDSLNYFWKYILPGGVILLDDYDGEAAQRKWPGVKIAVDEFCENNDVNIMRGFGNLAYLIKS